jgi:uncharacterized protein
MRIHSASDQSVTPPIFIRQSSTGWLEWAKFALLQIKRTTPSKRYEMSDRSDNAAEPLVADVLANILLQMLRAIVDHLDAVTIRDQQEGETLKFMIVVAKADMARVIGARGRMANSFRVIGRAMGLKYQTPIDIEFASIE